MLKKGKGKSKHSLDSSKKPSRAVAPEAGALAGFALLLIILNWLAYANSFQAGWHFDDGPNIIGNPDILISDLSWKSLSQAARSSPGGKRPLSYLSFALNYYLWGPEAVSFHVINLLIHTLNALLVLRILSLVIMVVPGIHPSKSRLLAFLGAALWSTSPLQTQSVTYVVQRMNLLSALFSLASFWFFLQWKLRAGRAAHLTLCIVCWLAALASKENCFLSPLCFLVFDWAVGERRLVGLRNLLVGTAAFCLLVGFTFWRYDLAQKIRTDYSTREFTMKERLLTQPRVVTFHLSQLLLPLPSRLALRHEVEKSTSLVSPVTTLPSICLLVLIAGAAYFCRKHSRVFSFWILWFLINLAVESTLLPLELIYEHRMYLPSIGIFAAVASAIASREGTGKPVPWSSLQYACMALIFLSAALSFARNQDWKDEITLWGDNSRKYPNSFRALNNLGSAYAKAGKPFEAEEALKRAMEVSPFYPPARANLGLLYLNQGRTREAVSVIRDFVEIGPTQTTRLSNFGPEVYFNFGVIYAKAGMLDRAIFHYGQAVNRRPDYPEAWFNLGLVYQQSSNYGKAVECFREFLRRWRGPSESPFASDATRRIKLLEDGT